MDNIQQKQRKSISNNIEKLCEEADKCVLLCANCHAETHWLLSHNLSLNQCNSDI